MRSYFELKNLFIIKREEKKRHIVLHLNLCDYND